MQRGGGGDKNLGVALLHASASRRASPSAFVAYWLLFLPVTAAFIGADDLGMVGVVGPSEC